MKPIRNLDSTFSPLEYSDRFQKWIGVDIRIKRDDLWLTYGGGNKARKLRAIIVDVEKNHCNALITNGGVQSNHARVVALAAAERGWRCKLILHGNPNEPHPTKGNLLLMQLAGAEIQIVPAEEISKHIDKAFTSLEAEGAKPYVIPGGGHCLAGTLAYADAVAEVADQLAAETWIPDVIILPSGTGATQAGVTVGARRINWPTRIIGVSVGRPLQRGRQAVIQAIEEATSHLRLPNMDVLVDFRDDWLCGGYEKASPRILDVIRSVASRTGLLLDPTYTGKAFAALVDLVEAKEIRPGEKVLFWHTGGLHNLMASPYFTASHS